MKIPPIAEWISKGWLSDTNILAFISENLVYHYLKTGHAIPPPHIIKQKVIHEYAAKIDAKILFETGTYKGEMIEAQLPHFDRLYTIEIDKDLASQAEKKFSGKLQVSVHQGDSSCLVEQLVPRLDAATLFWLDGHYSPMDNTKGEKVCPILEEIESISRYMKMRPICLLIDDARLFVGQNDYPSIPSLRALIESKFSVSHFEVKYDIIRVICV